jgi:hypothetical protein
VNDKRLQATIVIWTAFTVVMSLLVLIGSDAASTIGGAVMLFTLAMTLIVGVTLSTTAIWKAGSESRSSDSIASSNKSKRDYRRVDRLIADLDEDEIYELESRLMAREEQASYGTKEIHCLKIETVD